MAERSKKRRWFTWITLVLGLIIVLSILLLLRLSFVTDYFYDAFVKDPPRQIPPGRNIVSPADGTVIYIRKIEDGNVPEVVKRGVPIPLQELIKASPEDKIKKGYLIGIYMNVESVHITRVPVDGTYIRRIVFNGPHMSMTKQEKAVILTSMIPGLVTIKKLLGMDPYSIEKYGDYILKSARETSVFKDQRDTIVYVIRIADYWVGNILTWIQTGQEVEKGQKMGMITWGSQVDICFEQTDGMRIKVSVGDYVYGGETILADYEK